MIFCKKLEKKIWEIEHKPRYSISEIVGMYRQTPLVMQMIYEC